MLHIALGWSSLGLDANIYDSTPSSFGGSIVELIQFVGRMGCSFAVIIVVKESPANTEICSFILKALSQLLFLSRSQFLVLELYRAPPL